jgi:hypothetical protein
MRNGKKARKRVTRKQGRRRRPKTEHRLVEPQSSALDLRTARPVRRVAGQVRILVEGLSARCATIETWTHPKGRGAEPNAQVVEAHTVLAQLLDGFPGFFKLMDQLDEQGFSPPRKSFTASTKEGDRIAVLESYRLRYADFMPPALMVDLHVDKKHPGMGGGLVVSAPSGEKMKVAKCHVVKLS